MIDGVSSRAGRLIEAAQPFSGTLAARKHPLWVLQDLSNTDKHRVIPVSIVALEVLEARDSDDDITYADWFTMTGFGALHDNALLGKFPKGDRFIDLQLHCTMAFEQVATAATNAMVPVLRSVYLETAGVMDRLRAEVERT